MEFNERDVITAKVLHDYYEFKLLIMYDQVFQYMAELLVYH